MKTPLLQQLKAHLASLTKEEFMVKWAKIEELEMEGPTVEEFFNCMEYHEIISRNAVPSMSSSAFSQKITAGESNYAMAA